MVSNRVTRLQLVAQLRKTLTAMFLKKPDLVRYVYQKNLDDIDAALGTGVNINQGDKDGRTPLMHAVLDDEADGRFVRSLLERGADVTTHDREQKWTALHFAARDQKAQIVEILIQSGADVNALDSFGNTPLWRAIMNDRVDVEVIGILLRNGADPDKANRKGVSPRKLAETLGKAEISRLLSQRDGTDQGTRSSP